MHEQSVLVTDLINLNASEFAIEKERRKLRILELARFKQFRHSVWDKVRQKYAATTTKMATAANNASNDEKSTAEKLKATKSATSAHLPSLPQSPASLVVAAPQINAASESVDMSIDVQINIECGQCLLRANQPFSGGVGGTPSTQMSTGATTGGITNAYTSMITPQQRILTKKPSARDLKAGKMLSSGSGQPLIATQSITKLSIPRYEIFIELNSKFPKN